MSTPKQEKMIDSAYNGNLEHVKACLKHDTVDLDGRDQLGYTTALMNACEHGHDHVAEYLLEEGADIEAKRPFTEYTALALACQEGHSSTAKLLLDYWANIAAIDSIYCLHSVAQSGNDVFLKLLLDCGADADAVSWNGTPLHRACSYGRTKCVEVLLRHGADAGKTHNRKSPLDVAQEYGFKAIIDLLMKHTNKKTSTYKHRLKHCQRNQRTTNHHKFSSTNVVVPHLKQEVRAYVVEEDYELTLLEKKLTSKMQAMERKFEKQLIELSQQQERKEKETIEVLKRESRSDLIKANYKILKLENQMKEVSTGAVNADEKLTLELQEANESIDQSNEEVQNLDEEMLQALGAFESCKRRLAESKEKVSHLETQLTEASFLALNEKITAQIQEMVLKCKDEVTTECTNNVSKLENKISDVQKSIAVEVGKIKEQVISGGERNDEKDEEMNESISKLSLVEVSRSNEKLLKFEKEEGKEMTKVLMQALYDHLKVFAETTLEEKMDETEDGSEGRAEDDWFSTYSHSSVPFE
jgi:ankyrin repeat protein